MPCLQLGCLASMSPFGFGILARITLIRYSKTDLHILPTFNLLSFARIFFSCIKKDHSDENSHENWIKKSKIMFTLTYFKTKKSHQSQKGTGKRKTKMKITISQIINIVLIREFSFYFSFLTR